MPLVLDREVYRDVLESLGTGVCLLDLERRILFWNDGAEKISGYFRHEVAGRSCFDNLLAHCDENNALLCGDDCPLVDAMRDGKAHESSVYLRHKSGHRVPVRVRAVPLRDAQGSIVGIAESFEERVVQLGADVLVHAHSLPDSRDAISGLLDRESTLSHLNAAVEDFQADRIPFGVIALAIDRLDEFQEAHGRIAAESMLNAAARTLAGSVGPADAVGRWSENRFIAIITGCPAGAVEKVAARLQRMAGLTSIGWWGDRVSVTVSAGGCAVESGEAAETLLSRSERALAASLAEGDRHITIV